MKTLNTVMLIDDDEADNFLHTMVIEDTNLTKNIKCFSYADHALESLKNDGQEDIDLIFIDINMPLMSGFEFVEVYKKSLKDTESNIVIYMLSTSNSPSDMQKAESSDEINGFIQKPLHDDVLRKIVKKHFCVCPTKPSIYPRP